MPLTVQQRARPHRSVSERNYQTYLERSFAEARLDEMSVWWDDGVVHKVLQNDKHATGFMRAAVSGLSMGLLLPEVAFEWLERLWSAGASRLSMADKERWLDQLVAFPTLSGFLLDRDVSPHAPMARYGYSGQAASSPCVQLLSALLDEESRSSYAKPRWSPEQLERGWVHLDRLWAMPGWKSSQRAHALSVMTWRFSSVSEEVRDRLKSLRDRIVGGEACPFEGENSALRRWLTSQKSKEDSGEFSDSFSAWGRGLFGAAPDAPAETYGDLWFWREVAEARSGVELMPFLMQWGRLPWHVSPRQRAMMSERSDTPERTILSLWWTEKNSYAKPLPPETWPTWRSALTAVAAAGHPPDATWQAVAVRDWSAPVSRFSNDPLSPEEWSQWISGWQFLGALGNWKEKGVPPKVAEALGHTVNALASGLPADRWSECFSVFQSLGVMPEALFPSYVFSPSPASSRAPFELAPAWNAFRAWCTNPALFQQLLASLPKVLSRCHDAVAAMADALRPDANSEQPSCLEQLVNHAPDWLTERGASVFLEALSAGNVVAPLLLASRLPSLPAAEALWAAWALGVQRSGSQQPGGATLTPACGWMALARTVIVRGADPNAGASSHLPLAVVAGRAYRPEASQSIQWLLDHGAVASKATPSPCSGAAYRLWSSACEAEQLACALPSPDENRSCSPRRARM